MDESFDASAVKYDVNPDVKPDVNSIDEQAFVSTDTSEKVVKNFRRVSVDTTTHSLDTINVDVIKNHTDLSFSNYQFKFNDKEMHMVTNPKYLSLNWW